MNFIFFDFAKFSVKVTCLLLTAHCLLLTAVAQQQRIAILTPEKNQQAEYFAEKLAKPLGKENKIIDSDLSEVAFRSFDFEKPFNLTLKEAKNIGTAIGCDYFLLIKSNTQRRISLEKADYFDSYAIIYAVSSRTGKLVFWKLQNFEDTEKTKAQELLFDSVEKLSEEISEKITKNQKAEINEKTALDFEEIPDADSPEAVGFRPPLPYKRIRPKYTDIAKLYGVEATVDIEIDVSEEGEILRSEIVRWAGFGLDESVKKTVREMNWRPASKNKKPLPIRALLRYNFKDIENN